MKTENNAYTQLWSTICSSARVLICFVHALPSLPLG